MNYGLQAKCISEPMVNKTVLTTKLTLKDGEIVKLQQTRILYNRCSSFNISCSFGRMDYPLDIPTYCGNPSFLNQEPVSLCAGKEVTTNFVYSDSAVKFTDLSVINWTVRKTKQDKAEIFSYYDKAAGFKIRTVPGDRFKDRVTWVNNTINLKFSDLKTNDTGIYDVDITIFGAGKEESKDTNGTFQLTVNAKDKCESNGEGMSTGTIVGVVVGLLVLLIITLVIVLVLIKKRKDIKGLYMAALSK
ncbi:Hypothetical predicted protein [Mytilus galloprovincialis]|uniref:Immunoglobulin V-set domain-containing protein n=2 Tax=Mytilus galloprovincialis TaxID=29158 RepID=A0A8B6CB71_MYTGA|nr:Hypothetical predicted protein [Mytilus galloprovincialis]